MTLDDNTGIDALIKSALPSLWRFALQITRDNHDAEDLVQRTCLRALERSESYEDMQKPKSWLFRIAQNIWKNEVRSRSIRDKGFVKTDSPNSLTAQQEIDKQTPDTWLELNDVVKAVQALPEAQRMVIILVAVHGFSYQETATILDVPIGTVMSRLARARMSMGKLFLSSNDKETSHSPVHKKQAIVQEGFIKSSIYSNGYSNNEKPV